MSEDETAACKSCGSAIPVESVECPECGNRPEFELRKYGATMALLGSFGAPLINLYGGAFVMFLGFMVITSCVIRPLKPTEYDFEFFM